MKHPTHIHDDHWQAIHSSFSVMSLLFLKWLAQSLSCASFVFAVDLHHGYGLAHEEMMRLNQEMNVEKGLQRTWCSQKSGKEREERVRRSERPHMIERKIL